MRPLLARLAPRLANDVPDAAARDSVEHTWPAYRDALSALIENNPLPDSIDKPRRPTLIILGDDDSQAPPEDVLAHPHEHVRVEVWRSDHLLPLRHADRLANLLHAELRAPTRSLPNDASTRPAYNDASNSRAPEDTSGDKHQATRLRAVAGATPITAWPRFDVAGCAAVATALL